MKSNEKVLKIYDENVDWYASERARTLEEEKYLDRVIAHVPRRGTVLDIGCGIGLPIAAYFSSNGFTVTGVDGSQNMIARARQLLPELRWVVADMRTLHLGFEFDAVVAWDSFFHLMQDEQRRMFDIFLSHLSPSGVLIFTSGPEAGEAIGELNGHELYHSSLSADEYNKILKEKGFEVLCHEIADPDCGGHTVWIARRTL